MIEVTLYGRGGQGSVVGARMLAYAAVMEGKYGQQSQSPTGERRGAPVAGWVRIDDKKIRVRAPIISPDYLMVLDPGMVYTENVDCQEISGKSKVRAAVQWEGDTTNGRRDKDQRWKDILQKSRFCLWAPQKPDNHG